MTSASAATAALQEVGLKGAKVVSTAFGTLTSGARMTPSVLIVGAQRCGTTSMFKALRQHPAVLPPALHKGVHYFDMHYDRGPVWYRAHFPLRANAARVARAIGESPITVESSPYYMFHPLAARRFTADLPGVRLLVLVRDPVERAYSAHSHESARGFETEPFERAIELEPERLAGQVEALQQDPRGDAYDLQHHGYLTRGRYVEQLRRLESLVGRDRIHVIDSQAFFDAPVEAFARVTDFLGLSSYAGAKFDKHNARRRSPMSEELRTRLTAHFEPYDEELATWLGHMPSWRR